MRVFDRALSILLAIGGAGHGFVGTLLSSPLTERVTLWSFSGSLAIWAIAGLNWLRSGRPGDRLLALFALLGASSWALMMVWLMEIAEMWGDPRPWSFIVICLLLALRSARDAARRGSPATKSEPG